MKLKTILFILLLNSLGLADQQVILRTHAFGME